MAGGVGRRKSIGGGERQMRRRFSKKYSRGDAHQDQQEQSCLPEAGDIGVHLR